MATAASLGGAMVNELLLETMIWERRKNPALYKYYMDNRVKFVAGAGQ
jgi:hypothetical protein